MRPPPTENFRSPAALACFLVTAIVLVALDLWTKRLAVEHLKHTGEVIQLIPGWLHFTYTENRGAVFGLGQGRRALFLVVSIGAIGFLIWMFAVSDRQRVYQVILGMLIAGVVGNLYDRLKFGYVRDMIHALPRWPDFFPWIFNIADSLLCVGVVLMIVYSFFHRPAPEQQGFQTVSTDASETPPPRQD